MVSKKHPKTYGDEKALDMARSILPSNSRVVARANKRNWSSKRRAAWRNELSGFRGLDVQDALEFADDVPYPHTMRTLSRVRSRVIYDVWDRREADKLNHFCRWAESVTRDIDVDEQLEHMARLLPDSGIIGGHALSHLRFVIGPNAHKYWSNRSKRSTDDDLADLLYILTTNGEHKEFNRRVKKLMTHVYDRKEGAFRFVVTIRPFLGIHDIDEYAAQIRRTNYRDRPIVIEILREMTIGANSR